MDSNPGRQNHSFTVSVILILLNKKSLYTLDRGEGDLAQKSASYA